MHAFIGPFGRAVVSGNTVAIVGADAVAVIDTGHHPRLQRAIIAEIPATAASKHPPMNADEHG